MRLGGHWFTAHSVEELDTLATDLDTYGLSAVSEPMLEMDLASCAVLGQKAESLGIVVGEKGMWENLMSRTPCTIQRR